MKKRCLQPALCCALLLCLGLSACSPQDRKVDEKPVAMHMHWLRDMASEEVKFEAVRAAGVRIVEVSGRHGLSADELKALLGKYELRAVEMYTGGGQGELRGLEELRNNFDELVAFNKVIGSRVLVAPFVERSERPTTAAGWLAVGRELGRLAERAKSAGMILAYHNHGYEMAEFEGKTVLELIFEGAGPALQAELDLGWVASGGQDPVAMLEKLSGRVYSIHAKDYSPGQGFTNVGQGTLNWAAILPAAKRAGVQWYIIDHADPVDPVASIKTSAEYLRKHLP